MSTPHARRFLPLALVLFASPLCAAEPALPADHAERMVRGQELFTKQVRPLLVEKCLRCHGEPKIKGEFDLANRETLLKGGHNGVAIVPFKPKESRLLRLIAHTEEPNMPANAARLSDAQIALLTNWIDLGAPYDKPLLDRKTTVKKPMVVTDEDRKWWSFAPLKRPEVPKTKTPARTPIDAFLLARLEEKGLSPNPQADRRTLIRRAYFDLIGLPPTPEEVEAFVSDKSPDAYEKVIDKLLASPHFGERWGRHWLDIARFAESHGFEHDYDRPNAYHYRDFVIKALNQDLPYDTFVKWQLAGDEIAPDNPLAMMATGFLAAGVHSTQITKNQVEKERYDELDDMLRTTGTAMLGVTVGCCRCHDHKFDPFPVRDYYRLLSIFTTTVRSDYDIDLDPAATKAAKAKWEAEHAPLVAALAKFEKEQLPARLEKWLAERRAARREPAVAKAPRWLIVEPTKIVSQGGATLTPQADGSLLATGTNPDVEAYRFTVQTPLKGITAIRIEALAHPSLVKGGPGRAENGNFALSDFRVTASPPGGKGEPKPVKLVNPKATFEQKGLPVAAAIDGDTKTAWAVDPQFGKDHAAVFEVEGDVGFDGGTVLNFLLNFQNNKKHSIGRVRLSLSTAPKPATLDGDAMPADAAMALAVLDADPKAKLTEEQRGVLLKWYRTQDATWRDLSARVQTHLTNPPKSHMTKVLISSEGVPAVRLHTQGGDFLEHTHFLTRGDPNQKGDVATPGYLQVLMRNPEQEKRWLANPPPGWRTSYRRTGLANWITDVDQGAGHLLARVIVNRLWQHHMGRGIVGTPSDFGFQGERPTHPELLDWLASELIRNGWRLKPIHKLIMTSAAYRQIAEIDEKKAIADHDNRLFWRHPRTRLEAEVIRDAMLAVSGTLDTRQFGPGTLDPNMKRRSIYFTVKRSKLVPSMVLFDAPDALQGLDRRAATVIAPQALLVINSAVVRGYADGFAQRLDEKGERPFAETVKAGYMTAVGRPPSEDEAADTVEFLEQQTAAYKADGKDNPRRRALTDFCQVLLGLNEFIYVD